jgi:hypothetical protein
MANSNSTDGVTLSLSDAEALVLFEFLSRFANDEVLAIEDQSEARVLWNLQASLEKELSEAFREDYLRLLETARNVIRDKE